MGKVKVGDTELEVKTPDYSWVGLVILILFCANNSNGTDLLDALIAWIGRH